MRKLGMTKEALDFVRGLEAKPFKQVMNKVLSLLGNPAPTDSIRMKGFEALYRTDIGENRIVYRFDADNVAIIVIGKRNDDEVCKQVDRKKP